MTRDRRDEARRPAADLGLAEAVHVIKLTVRHVYDFGADRELVGDDLVRPEAWDALRVRTDGPFSMARDRAELERVRDEHPEIGERARVIDRLLRERGASSLASYGVGGAVPKRGCSRSRPRPA